MRRNRRIRVVVTAVTGGALALSLLVGNPRIRRPAPHDDDARSRTVRPGAVGR